MYFSISFIYYMKNTRKSRPPPLQAKHSKYEIFCAAQISNNYVGAITVLYWKQKEYAKFFLSLRFRMFIFWDYICFCVVENNIIRYKNPTVANVLTGVIGIFSWNTILTTLKYSADLHKCRKKFMLVFCGTLLSQ